MAAAKLSAVRIGRMTASRVAAALDLSPFLSREQLRRLMVRERLGEEKEWAGNFITERGEELEPVIIAEYELTRGVRVRFAGAEQKTRVHPKYPFLAGTPDGLTDRVIEGKAPWRAPYTSIAQRPDYQAQLQMLMEVTGLKLADFCIYRPGQPLIVDTVEHDPSWLPGVLPTIRQFLKELDVIVADPALAAPYREPLKDDRTDDAWAGFARDWLEADYVIKQLEAQRKAAGDALAALSPTKSARGFGVDFLRFPRRNTVRNDDLIEAGLVTEQQLSALRGQAKEITVVRRVGTPKKGETA